LLALSVASVAVMLERAWLLLRIRGDVRALERGLRERLDVNDVPAARELLLRSRSAEAVIVRAGLAELARGPNAIREALAAATLLQRARLERGLNYLATLASNAPFIGLFGTVIGIILAFERLSAAGARGSASAAVMASIAEALVATAVGIGVAVPAVVAFNAFQKRIRVILDQATALGHVLLVHAEGMHACAPIIPLRAKPSAARDRLADAAAALAARTVEPEGA
jgi:biopolymer transport protein ExbB